MESEIIPGKGRNWAYIFSPCMILMIVTVLTLMIIGFSGQQGITELLFMVLCVPTLIASVVVDILLKVAFSETANRGQLLWIIQSVILFTLILALIFVL